MKVVVTGSRGQLGTDVVLRLGELGFEAVGAALPLFDITDKSAVDAFITKEKPDAIIHCAAYTSVERAENDYDLCRRVNAEGTANVAAAAEKVGAKLVYVSTDYVFGDNGTEPLETDAPKNPMNVYGKTKLEGEQLAQQLCSRCFVARTSWVFGLYGGNFVRTIMWVGKKKKSLSVVDDQIGTPTYTRDLAVLLCDMIQTEKYGVYHTTNEGFCSWAEFAKLIVRLSGVETEVVPVPTEGYPTVAKRQKNSRLSKASLDEAGFFRLPTWQDALERYMTAVKQD